MSEPIRILRFPKEGGAFRMKRDRLTAEDAARVKAVVNELRTAAVLPREDDLGDVIPPCYPAWARSVPGTQLWVVYSFGEASLTLWTIKATVEVPVG